MCLVACLVLCEKELLVAYEDVLQGLVAMPVFPVALVAVVLKVLQRFEVQLLYRRVLMTQKTFLQLLSFAPMVV